MKKRVAVIGAGAWGTAIATLLAANKFHVNLWCYENHLPTEIRKFRLNQRYLPSIFLSPAIHPTGCFSEALDNVDLIFFAVPVQFMRKILVRMKSSVIQKHKWIILSKGIEEITLALPTQIIEEIFGYAPTTAILAGPSFARDLAKKHPTGVTLSGTKRSYTASLRSALSCSYFTTTINTDPLGTQAISASKNIVALGVGLLDGAGFNDNTKALLITKSLTELAKVVRFFGGQKRTLYDLCGLGDILLTCMGSLSRNVAIGRKISTGARLTSLLEEMSSIPEGVNTSRAFSTLSQQHQLALPLCTAIHDVIHGIQPIHRLTHLLTS